MVEAAGVELITVLTARKLLSWEGPQRLKRPHFPIHCTFIVRKYFWLRSRGAGRCPRIAQVRKAARGVEISLARVIVIDLRAENSRTRCAAFGVGVNSEAGCSQAAGVSTNSLAMANVSGLHVGLGFHGCFPFFEFCCCLRP
jgi:hypothetical protein